MGTTSGVSIIPEGRIAAEETFGTLPMRSWYTSVGSERLLYQSNAKEFGKKKNDKEIFHQSFIHS